MNQLSPSQWSVKQKHFLRSIVWINAFILPRRRQHKRLVTLRAVDFVQTGQLESVGQWIVCSLPVLGTARQPTVFFYWGLSLLSLWRCDNRKWAGHPDVLHLQWRPMLKLSCAWMRLRKDENDFWYEIKSLCTYLPHVLVKSTWIWDFIDELLV